MTALLVDADSSRFIEEKTLGRQEGKNEFIGLLDAPEQEHNGHRFKEQSICSKTNSD